MHRILVINPGSTTTKIALYHDDMEQWRETIHYNAETLSPFKKINDQLPLRKKDILTILGNRGIEILSFSAIAARGGPYKPLQSGTYAIDNMLIDDIQNHNVQFEHASNLAALIAFEMIQGKNIPAYFVDPVCVDEMEPLARISGLPELERKSLLHALNIRAVAREASLKIGKDMSDLNFVVAHLGGGISICAMKKGRMIDVNNAVEEGPFSPERSGSLPISSLVKYIYQSEIPGSEMRRKIVGKGGLTAYLGTNNAQEVEKRIENGDPQARLVYESMAYQIGKEIGAMTAVLNGEVDAILLTGSLAHSQMLMNWIVERVKTFSKILLYPGEHEMKALASGVLRVLKEEEKVKTYA